MTPSSPISLFYFLWQIIDQCRAPQNKIDPIQERWWTQISATAEYQNFLAKREEIHRSEQIRWYHAADLLTTYQSIRSHSETEKQPFGELAGKIYCTPSQFGLWMPGVALMAAYLSQKKGIHGLFVCRELESLSHQIQKISASSSDQRLAFIVSCTSSAYRAQPRHFPQHKVAVCVEKKGAVLSIALLDAMPLGREDEEIDPKHLSKDLWSGEQELGQYNFQELVLRAILAGCPQEAPHLRLFASSVVREKTYGCDIFALLDGVAFLRDPDFFDKIHFSKEKRIPMITRLPPEFMVGAQSPEMIDEYEKRGGELDRPLIGKTKTLRETVNENLTSVKKGRGPDPIENIYIVKKLFKYLNIVILASKYFTRSEIDSILSSKIA